MYAVHAVHCTLDSINHAPGHKEQAFPFMYSRSCIAFYMTRLSCTRLAPVTEYMCRIGLKGPGNLVQRPLASSPPSFKLAMHHFHCLFCHRLKCLRISSTHPSIHPACADDKQAFCPHVPFGESRVIDCLEDNQQAPAFSTTWYVPLSDMGGRW